MLNVAPLQKNLCTDSALIGFPCTIVDFTTDKGTEVDANDFLGEILKFSSIPYVWVKGNISEQPDIVTIIKGLSFKGRQIIFSTTASENIDCLRMVKGIRFIISAPVPTSEENYIHIKTLACLQDYDELKLVVSNIEEYVAAKSFLRSRTITRSTVVFDIKAFSDKSEFFAQYLKDVEYFTFRTKISMKYALS